MYINEVKSQDQALAHLFFHCCLKDGDFNDTEMSDISAKLVEVGLYKQLDFKDEIVKYRNYRSSIYDETAYLEFLIKTITPVNNYALYSYCAELVLSDSSFDQSEETLLKKLASILEISAAEQDVIKKLYAQRKVVKSEHLI
jgi:uncharacterized tellurite resistance protein B-like protein